MLTIDDATGDGSQVLGRLGWIAREPFGGSVAVYRCWGKRRGHQPLPVVGQRLRRRGDGMACG